MASITVVSLSDQIFQYVAANPEMKTLAFSVHKQFTYLGYTKIDINTALTDMVKTGSLSIDEEGFLTIGSDDDNSRDITI